MKITGGLYSHMVLQRNIRNVSEALVTGTTAIAGAMVATICGKGYSRKLVLGRVPAGPFKVTLKGIPAGGPYAIELAVGISGEKTVVKDILVGDVWLLGGQSNMQGIGLLRDAPGVDPRVRAFYMHDCWAPARDSIHNLWDAVDPVHTALSGGSRPAPMVEVGAGPGVSFGQHMRKLTGVPQGLIACAHGGTSMTQWDPRHKDRGGHSLYGALLRRFHKNGGKVAGMIWYQGCSDANEISAPRYTARMRELISALRRDTGNRQLPVVIVQIARVIGWPESTMHWWNSIQEQQRIFPARTPHCAVVPAIDLQMDDAIHIGGKGQQILGQRLAHAMNVLHRGVRAGRPPVDVKGFTIERNRNGATDVVVRFANVTGSLQSPGLPTGFTIILQDGSRDNIYNVELRGDKAILHTNLPMERLAGASLHYGQGCNPYCNIVDAANRAVPVFGPLQLNKPKAVTPCVRTLRVSAFQPGAGALHKLEYPRPLKTLQLVTRTFPADFCDMHGEIGARAPEDLVLYYACRFRCEFQMDLTLLLGYDGPVKTWIDGKPVFHDPLGTNPAFPGRGKVRFTARPGPHEILLALGTNQGRAWGVFLALERRGVAAELVAKGPGCYAMPVILE